MAKQTKSSPVKVLVATKETQGQRHSDFSRAKEGELVLSGYECDLERIDGRCGCRRSKVGVETLSSTTTFKVVERNITDAKLIELVRESYRHSGWLLLFSEEEGQYQIETDVAELKRLADSFPIGAILEKRGERIRQRIQQSAHSKKQK